jgi:hypothetical protein
MSTYYYRNVESKTGRRNQCLEDFLVHAGACLCGGWRAVAAWGVVDRPCSYSYWGRPALSSLAFWRAGGCASVSPLGSFDFTACRRVPGCPVGRLGKSLPDPETVSERICFFLERIGDERSK